MGAPWFDPEALTAWLRDYGLEPGAGAPQPLGPHTWRLETAQGPRLLRTLQGAADAAASLGLMARAAAAGLPCPQPARTHTGAMAHTLADRPCAMLADAPGAAAIELGAAQLHQLGALLGRLHTAGIAPLRPHPYGGRWPKDAATTLGPQFSEAQRQLIERELFFQSLFRLHDVPRGLVHGGAWGDSVLFQGDAPTALLGFEAAGEGVLLYDVAVTAVHTCWREDGLDEARCHALLAGYRDTRPTLPIERGAWPVLLRGAALAAWLAALRAGAGGGAAEPMHARLSRLVADEARVRRTWE